MYVPNGQEDGGKYIYTLQKYLRVFAVEITVWTAALGDGSLFAGLMEGKMDRVMIIERPSFGLVKLERSSFRRLPVSFLIQ